MVLVAAQAHKVGVVQLIVGGPFVVAGVYLYLATRIPVRSEEDYQSSLQRSEELRGQPGRRAAFQRFAQRQSRLRYRSPIKAYLPAAVIWLIGAVIIFSS